MTKRRSSWFSAACRAAVALAAGALWALCFAPEPLVVVPWLALVPLILLLEGRRPVLSGWLFGLSFWATSMAWIPATVDTYGGLSPALAWIALVLLAGYLAVYPALFAGLGAWLLGGRRATARALAVLPALWVVTELLRGWVFTGFPWNLAGYAALDVPGMLAASSWLGVHGVSALLVAGNVAIAHGLRGRSWRLPVWTALAIAALASVAARDHHLETAGTRHARSGGGSAARQPVAVAVLQPNIPNATAYDPATVQRNYAKIFEQSSPACRPDTLLLWPESAVWPYAYERHPHLRADLARLGEGGCSVLLNSPFEGRGDRAGEHFNAALLVEPGDELGTVGRYDKQHLVPFGEYVPFDGALPFLQRLARAAGDFSKGEAAGNVAWGEEAIGVSICFEVIFPSSVAGKVQRGATLLATVTNDAWYGDTWAPWQHLRAARFRAAENRRVLLRAAITGVSVVIDADGSVRRQLGVGELGTITESVVGRERLSPYSRAPWAVPVVAWLVVAFAILRRASIRSSRQEEARENSRDAS